MLGDWVCKKFVDSHDKALANAVMTFMFRIQPFLTRYLQYTVKCEASQVSAVATRVQAVADYLQQNMSARINSWDEAIEGSHSFAQVLHMEHRLGPAPCFDTMHVQLAFDSVEELQQSLRQVRDFTSQRSEIEPQTSQPSEADEAICRRYDGSPFITARWKFAGCKIQEDIESIADSVAEHLDYIDGYYIQPKTGLVMAGMVLDFLVSVAEE